MPLVQIPYTETGFGYTDNRYNKVILGQIWYIFRIGY